MNDFVAEKGDKEGAYGYDDDTSETWDIIVDSINHLCSNDRINRGPAEAGKSVEDSNCVGLENIPDNLGLDLLILTPYQPNQYRESTICRNPKRGPKVEK